ncbi:MAG: M42 family metallopeptidase [Thermoproteales archaeon]|nr:M42 family metallopeptidase [Thermoproteales archaeon]
MQKIIDILSKLSDALGPSGFEDRVRDIIIKEIKNYADKIKIDNLGNLVAIKGEGKPRIMLDAHMDEIGFIVKYINEKGFIKVAALGGINILNVIGKEVILLGKNGDVHGILGSIPPHLLKKSDSAKNLPTIEDLFIDIGAKNKEDVVRYGIEEGTPSTFVPSFKENDDYVFGKAFDDRVGCAILVELVKNIEVSNGTIFFVFSVQEEVGLRGATIASNWIKPDLALALEGTIAADIPGMPEEKYVTLLGNGPAIRIMDASMIANRKLVSFIRSIAEAKRIPYQLQLSPYSGTDAGRIQFAGEGVPATVVSVPSRYIHSPISIAYKEDIEYTYLLVKEFLENILSKGGL